MRYLLAVDAGTGSGRAILFDEAGRQVSTSQQEWSHASDARYPGSMNFDYRKNWETLSGCIRNALRQAAVAAADVVAVSATSMREAIVLYDEQKQELWACANVDARAGAEVTALREAHPDVEDEIYYRTGETFALGSAPRLRWVKRHEPELYERTRYMSMLNDWIVFKLSGELYSEPSNAGTTGLLDLETRAWDPSIASRLGLKDDIFPSVVEPGSRVGGVTKEAAAKTGLRVGTPVVVGGGDAQLACAGLGLVHADQMAVLGGSFWQQEVNIAAPKTDPDINIRVNPHVVKDLWQAEAIVFYAGLMVRWFRDAFCQEEKRSAQERGIDTYSVLTEMASHVPPGAHGILPVFSDSMRIKNWFHAAPSLLNLNIDPERCGKPEIFRALLENAAIVTAKNLELIERFTGTEVAFITFAGGASKDPLWCQILADVTGKAVRVPVVKEATALGAAMTAGVGVEVYENLRYAAETLTQWERDYAPHSEHHDVYREVRQRWEAAYQRQLELAVSGITEPMWKAPGL